MDEHGERDIVKSKNVLIVEDSLVQADQLVYILERNGFTVYVASNGAEAFSILEKKLPDLVIADIIMPEMDGFEICHLIRSNTRTRNIPVILLSSLSSSNDVIAGLKCGADNFISEPFDEVRLVSQINHIFDNLKLIGQDRSDSWIQVTISGETNLIELNPVRMISFLIYSYETAIEQNTELRKISNELRYLSTHDFVTGLYNRTYFEEELKRLSLGREYPVSIIVADVDGLKTVNDSLGHAAGDSLLRLVSDILSESFRIGDVVARIGGDEFGVLLHNAGSEVVVDSIKRVRAKLKAIKVEDVGFCVSVSIGSTTAYTSDQMASALKLSDERMYIEKMIHKKNGYDVFVLV